MPRLNPKKFEGKEAKTKKSIEDRLAGARKKPIGDCLADLGKRLEKLHMMYTKLREDELHFLDEVDSLCEFMKTIPKEMKE